MKLKPSTILFITSFIPIPVFKIIARLGDATLNQARVAVVSGLILAGIQVMLSRHYLKHSNYLERAFLGFLAAGTVWAFMAPEHIASIFVHHSTALLYFVLFLTTLVPQLFGYDSFTFSIAKQMAPEVVWNTPQFRTINLHLTYFWSGIFTRTDDPLTGGGLVEDGQGRDQPSQGLDGRPFHGRGRYEHPPENGGALSPSRKKTGKR